MGNRQYGIDPDRLKEYAEDIKQLTEKELLFNIGKLKNTLDYTSIESIKEKGLHHFLEQIKYDLKEISTNINKLYFSQSY